MLSSFISEINRVLDFCTWEQRMQAAPKVAYEVAHPKGCLHNQVPAVEAAWELVAQVEGYKTICEDRRAYLLDRVQNFRLWLEGVKMEEGLSYKEAHAYVLGVVQKWASDAKAFYSTQNTLDDEFVWGGEEGRVDSLVDMYHDSGDLEYRLREEFDAFSMALSAAEYAADIGVRRMKAEWRSEEKDLLESGMTWLDEISEGHVGRVTGPDAILINRFRKRCNELRFQNKSMSYKTWAMLVNYSNDLLGIAKQYPVDEQMGCEGETDWLAIWVANLEKKSLSQALREQEEADDRMYSMPASVRDEYRNLLVCELGEDQFAGQAVHPQDLMDALYEG